MTIATNIQSITSELPANTKLVAISKTRTNEEIMEAYRAGQRIFGENKVQELVPKYHQLPKDIEWHLVGHLQSNKVKYIANFVHLIHSVDSLGLFLEIDKQARKINRVINCLLQVHIAEEETKFGLNEKELFELVTSPSFKASANVKINGLMGMASLSDNEEQIRNEFRHLAGIFKQLKETAFKDSSHFKELSMGMSSDYKIAVEEGSTFIRLGSKIFGERTYPTV
ncbi:MAG TPA: YggS family pyridoxal phosphate-dependent enzyme [Bacteroidales bacterium]